MSDELLPSDFAHMPCGGWCVGECPGCELDDQAPACGGTISRFNTIGEEGCTLYVPVRTTAASTAELEFDTSPETLQRLREALRRVPGRP